MEQQKKWLKYADADTIARLAQIGFAPAGRVAGSQAGNHRSPFHGFAVEFAGHRGYVPGDDTRHIDWKLYYRTERYLIKQYEQETNLLCHILVDLSRSMEFEYRHGRKRDYAARIATALAEVIVMQNDSVNVHFFADDLLAETGMTKSPAIAAQIDAFYTEYENILLPRFLRDGTGTGKPSRILPIAHEAFGSRRVVFIISDFFDDIDLLFDGVKRLLDRHHEIVLIQICDPLELHFDIPGKVRMFEAEGDRVLNFTGRNLRESYEEFFSGFLADFRKRCVRLGIDYILCDTSRGFGVQLAQYLSGKQQRGISGGGGRA